MVNEQTLSSFGNRGQMLEEMPKFLDQMYVYFLKILLVRVNPCFVLKTVPDLSETLMSEKRLLQASILLICSLKIINNPDMLEIGVVADLRSYLNSQEVVRCILLTPILHWLTLV